MNGIKVGDKVTPVWNLLVDEEKKHFHKGQILTVIKTKGFVVNRNLHFEGYEDIEELGCVLLSSDVKKVEVD